MAWTLTVWLFAVLLAGCVGPSTKPAPPPRSGIDVAPVATKPSPSTLPERWHLGAMLRVDVRAFQDSDGNGVGDLPGLIRRLDYVKDLGVRALVLAPTTLERDPRTLDPAIGTLADFDQLIQSAHERGLGVVLTYPLDRPRAAPAPAPDWHWRNPRVVDYHVHSLRHWLNRGVDGILFEGVAVDSEGFALSAGLGDPMVQQRMKHMATLADEVLAYANRLVVCDVPRDAQAWAQAEVCGAATHRLFVDPVVKAAKGDPASIRVLAEPPSRTTPPLVHSLSNLDRSQGPRLWDQVAADAVAYRLAAATYLLFPGTPLIHYGEEVGQASLGANASDVQGTASNRGPMSWTRPGDKAGFSVSSDGPMAAAPNAATHNVDAMHEDQSSLLVFYRDLIDLRNKRPSLMQGTYEPTALVSGTPGSANSRQVLSFQRNADNERTVVVINYGRVRADVEIAGLPRRARTAPIFPRRAGAAYVAEVSLADNQGKLLVNMPPRSVRVFDVELPMADATDQVLPPAPPRRRAPVKR